MAGPARTTRFRFWLWLIRLVGVIAPRRLRADWRQEWEAELRCREALLAEWERLDWKNKLDLLRRSASAFWAALWLQPTRLEDEQPRCGASETEYARVEIFSSPLDILPGSH